MTSSDPHGLVSVSTIIRLVKVVRACTEASRINLVVLGEIKLKQNPLEQSTTPSIWTTMWHQHFPVWANANEVLLVEKSISEGENSFFAAEHKGSCCLSMIFYYPDLPPVLKYTE